LNDGSRQTGYELLIRNINSHKRVRKKSKFVAGVVQIAPDAGNNNGIECVCPGLE
jgi:hypothetical protein